MAQQLVVQLACHCQTLRATPSALSAGPRREAPSDITKRRGAGRKGRHRDAASLEAVVGVGVVADVDVVVLVVAPSWKRTI